MFQVILNDGKELPNDDVFYLIAKNGVFLRKKTGLIDSLAPVDKISILQPIDPYASMDIVKISEKQVAWIAGFFKQVYDMYKSEAIVVLHYNEKSKKYKIEVPPQTVSGGGATYTGAQTFKGYNRIGTIHSHGSMGAFHSGTDDSDEEGFDGLHITFGSFNSLYGMSISSSVVINGMRIKVDADTYLEGITQDDPNKKETIINDVIYVTKSRSASSLGWNVNSVLARTFPKSWLDRVEKAKHVRYFVQGGYNRHSPYKSVVIGGTGQSSLPGFRDHNPSAGMGFRYGFNSEDYNIDPCKSCVFKNAEGSSYSNADAVDLGAMDSDDVMRYVIDNFDEGEVQDIAMQLYANERPPDPEVEEEVEVEVIEGTDVSSGIPGTCVREEDEDDWNNWL